MGRCLLMALEVDKKKCTFPERRIKKNEENNLQLEVLMVQNEQIRIRCMNEIKALRKTNVQLPFEKENCVVF